MFLKPPVLWHLPWWPQGTDTVTASSSFQSILAPSGHHGPHHHHSGTFLGSVPQGDDEERCPTHTTWKPSRRSSELLQQTRVQVGT